MKLEEEDEEEEQEAAALDLSVNPASIGGRLIFSGSKKKSFSSLGSSSSRDSLSSDSETSEALSCQAQGQTGVLTVHSYAKGDGRVTMGDPCTKKKGSAPRSLSEQELAEVCLQAMVWDPATLEDILWREGGPVGWRRCSVQESRRNPMSVPPACIVVSDEKPGDILSFLAYSVVGIHFLLLAQSIVSQQLQ